MISALLTKTKGGWIIKREDTGRTQTLFWKSIPQDLDGKNIKVEMGRDGQPLKICFGEVTISRPGAQPVNTQQQKGPNQPIRQPQRDTRPMNENNPIPQTDFAKAPYNFIPLNETVVQPFTIEDLSENRIVNFDHYSEEKYTGKINLTLQNLTHLMISRGGEKIGDRTIHDFLKIGSDGKAFISGSSFRGLIRKSAGIISHSGLYIDDHYHNHPLFFRGVAGGIFGSVYQPHFFNLSDQNDYKPLAGYLKKEQNEFRIYHAIADSNGVQYYKIRKVDNQNNAVPPREDHLTKKTIFEFDGRTFDKYLTERIFFLRASKSYHLHRNRRLKYALITKFSFTTREPNFSEGNFINTGPFGRKKHDQWIINLKNTINAYTVVGSNVINDYKADVDREEMYDVLKNLEKSPNHEVPVFYLLDVNGQIKSFGHTPLYRIKHRNEIKDGIHQFKDVDKFDFEQVIFGKLGKIATRVFFDDLVVQQPDCQTEPVLIKILSSPKPTSHQLYLKSGTWSSDTPIDISGTKEYWHKKTDANFWRDNALAQSKSHAGYIKAINPNHLFKGSIRFENLTAIELGCLLSTIELPENCCYKIGMGKPHGLGSIKITEASLSLDDRTGRYKTLLTEDGKWNLPIIKESPNIHEFIKEFETFILNYLNLNMIYESIWEIPRLIAYKSMLFFDEKLHSSEEWLKQTRYLEIERKFDDHNNLHRDQHGNSKPKNEFAERKSLEDPISFLNRMKL